MSIEFKRRLAAAESRVSRVLSAPIRWVRVIWEPGQRWADALKASGWQKGDAAIVRRVIDAHESHGQSDDDLAQYRAFAASLKAGEVKE